MTNPSSGFSRYFAVLVLLAFATPFLTAQNQLAFAGLRSVVQQGQFNAVQTDSSGNIYLLLDQHDGVRILKTDASASTILAQALLGAAGDVGLAMALDPGGDVYIAGTTTSTTLTGTSGAAIPTRTDSSTNSFVARFDSSLNPIFVTFTGGSRISAASIAATTDAVFVTGTIYTATLPVTPSAIQQAPAFQSTSNGFVERFSASGSTLVYATYLTGAAGSTTPTAIAADASDNAYLVGSTSSAGFPTISAVVPAILGNPSGFLTKLTPAGDGITFSSYIPGAGLTSLALDSTRQILLLTGSISVGQFPVDIVSTPLVQTNYQTLIRMPLDGSKVLSATLLAPGTGSFVATNAAGSVWVDGTLTVPLLPIAPLSTIGQGFSIGLTAQNTISQTARFGGLPNGNPTFASLPLTFTSLSVDASGEPIFAGAVQPTASSSLLATQTYDLPLTNATSALPSSVSAAKLTSASCSGSLCAGSAAYLAKLNGSPSAPSLALSIDDAPGITLRNLGSVAATSLQLSATGASLTSNCPTTLYAGGECSALLTGSGTLTASAANATTQTVAVPTFTAAASTIVFSPKELDFGIQTSTSASATRILTVTNLGLVSQTFLSQLTTSAKTPPTTFTQTGTDCTATTPNNTLVLAAGGTCHITLVFNPSSTAGSDAFEQAEWTIGTRNVLLTGYQQAASLAVSAPEIDFGTEYSGGLTLPRYLYLSNSSSAAVSHSAVSTPSGSPFSVADHCPASLAPSSVCQILITYLSTVFPASDSTTLALDQGLSVLVTGESLPQPKVGGTSVNPNLSVTPASVSFGTAVPVTTVSGSSQVVTIANVGTSPFALSLGLTGNFTETTNCGATLAGGNNCAVILSFAPGQPGTSDGLLSVTAGAGTTPAYVQLSGTGSGILSANNGTLDQGSLPVGQPGIQWYKVSQPFNTLSVATTGPFTAILVEDIGYGHGQPASSAFSAATTGSCTNCYLGIQFIASLTGVQTGTMSLTSSAAGNPYVLTLSGTGLPLTGLLLSPLTQDFGIVPLHSTSGPELFTLTNLSGASVTLSSPVLTGDFAVTAAPTGGAVCGGTLESQASCFLQLAFVPTVTGDRTGSVTLSSGTLSATATLTGYASSDPGIALNPTTLTFNNVPGITATQQTLQVTNTSSASVQVGATSAATSCFTSGTTCGTLAPTGSCAITVTYIPGAAAVTNFLTLPITQSINSNPPTTTNYTVPLAGAYTSASAGLQILPLLSEFGPVATGTLSAPRLFTVNNLTAKSLILNLQMPRQFVLSGVPCATLAPNASCTFSAAFLPLTNSDVTGSIIAQAVPSDGSANLQGIGYLEGYGVGSSALTITGPILAGVVGFGQIGSGQSAAKTFTLTNSSTTPLTIRRLTSAPPFLTTSTCGTILTLAQSCTVTITYTPVNQVATGTVSPINVIDSGTLVIESDAVSSPDTLLLSGQGSPLAVGSPSNARPILTDSTLPGSISFATTTVGNPASAQDVILTNTGTATLQINSATIVENGLAANQLPDFTVQNGCASLVVGASCSIAVTSDPQASGEHVAALQIGSTAANSLDFISLLSTGSPSVLLFSPGSLSFGSVLVGSSVTQTIQVTNASSSAVLFEGIAATTSYRTSGTCPAAGLSLTAGGVCSINVIFTPSATGVLAGTVSLTSSASLQPLTVSLTGSGIQSQLVIAPTALGFGNITIGASANLSLTLSNTGSASLNAVAFAVTGDYAITTPCGVTSIPAGGGCTVQITFTPTTSGSRPGTLTVSDSLSTLAAVVPLTGTGLLAGDFTLSVSSASATVTSGTPALYTLAITPVAGYTGAIALTCTPITAGEYASCALLPASITLAGTGQVSTATINTVTSISGTTLLEGPRGPSSPRAMLCVLLPGILALWSLRRRRIHPLLSLILMAAMAACTGCGGTVLLTNATNPNLRYTPAGTYQYQITASSISGVQITHAVTLSLTVQ